MQLLVYLERKMCKSNDEDEMISTLLRHYMIEAEEAALYLSILYLCSGDL